MNIIIERLNKIKSNIQNKKTQVVAVSKTFPIENIKPLIEIGHIHFGENKVQEADSKWSNIKKINPNIQLHMVGRLQSNKAKRAVELFDYIHSLDSKKLAENLSKFENNINKKLKYFIQVNVGSEKQKAGITPNELDEFYTYCKKKLNLNIIGLMVIPPNDGNEEKYFKYLYETNSSLGLEHLSMGMSADYLIADKYNATFLRIGSSIFGKRD
ncbi:YggS family pyridoxal phosphate-dependent enzyme [Pelagibacteraceae bacterium]|jgi:pyridoxal phosphate enzyme (YggS family)|nr:YggS family pyridoxal phosphate-dependent enzyme [Pelagibacteraceae bacterium]